MTTADEKQKDSRRCEITCALAGLSMALDNEIHGLDKPEQSEAIQSGLATAMVILSDMLKQEL
jgi:hypothetical protein